jgi:hypothetical protein
VDRQSSELDELPGCKLTQKAEILVHMRTPVAIPAEYNGREVGTRNAVKYSRDGATSEVCIPVAIDQGVNVRDQEIFLGQFDLLGRGRKDRILKSKIENNWCETGLLTTLVVITPLTGAFFLAHFCTPQPRTAGFESREGWKFSD